MSTPSYGELGTVFITLQNSLRNYLRRRVEEAAVEDLLQDIFVKALTAIKANKAPKNLPGWLYSAARTTVIDYYRAKRPAEILDDNVLESESTTDEALHVELATCLRPLVHQLPEIYSKTLLATDFGGRIMKDLAREEGLSVSAVKSRASRARVMLKEKLLDCCHVEISDGMVKDYHCRSSQACRGGCA